MTKETKCRACQADIIFIKTKAGKSVPCDAKSMYFTPEANGTQVFVLMDGSVQRGKECPGGGDGCQIGYISHFATCPNADLFRKPRKKDRKAR